MLRVLIADDHFLVREGLKQIIASTPDMQVAGEAANGSEVLRFIRNNPVSLLLVDMTMPGTDGIDLVKRIKGERPLLPILVLTMHGEPQLAAKAFQVGAAGYVTKGKGAESLLLALRKVASGQRYVDPDLAEKIIFDVKTPADAMSEQLTSREFQVLEMLQAGRTVTQIGYELALSPKTVSSHKIRIMRKLNCHNNAELLKYSDHLN